MLTTVCVAASTKSCWRDCWACAARCCPLRTSTPQIRPAMINTAAAKDTQATRALWARRRGGGRNGGWALAVVFFLADRFDLAPATATTVLVVFSVAGAVDPAPASASASPIGSLLAGPAAREARRR